MSQRTGALDIGIIGFTEDDADEYIDRIAPVTVLSVQRIKSGTGDECGVYYG